MAPMLEVNNAYSGYWDLYALNKSALTMPVSPWSFWIPWEPESTLYNTNN